MHTALVSADTSTSSGLQLVNVLILVAIVAIGWPLFRKLRKAASESRRRRWIEEGLMDPPEADTEPAAEADTEPAAGPNAEPAAGSNAEERRE